MKMNPLPWIKSWFETKPENANPFGLAEKPVTPVDIVEEYEWQYMGDGMMEQVRRVPEPLRKAKEMRDARTSRSNYSSSSHTYVDSTPIASAVAISTYAGSSYDSGCSDSSSGSFGGCD